LYHVRIETSLRLANLFYICTFSSRMKKFKLQEGSFLKNVVILMFGSGLSQLIPFLFSPVLSRLFDTDDFGVFTLFITISAFLGVLASFRYDLAIMLPKKKSDAFHLLVLSVGLSIVIGLLVFITALIFPDAIGKAVGSDEIVPWLPWLGLSAFFLGTIQSLNMWHNRNKSYRTLSGTMVAQSSTTAVLSTINGFAKLKAGGLILGSLAGQFIATTSFVYRFLKEDAFRLKWISPKRIKVVAKTYIEYPKFSLPHRMVDMVSITGIPLILMMIFTESIVGLYGFMLRILKAPIGVLASSLGQVFYQQFSEKVSRGESVRNLFLKTERNIALITAPFFIIIMLWGPELFAFIFSEQWREAGIYAQYLAPWLFFSTLTSPVSQIPLTLKYVKANMWAGIMNNLLLIMIFVIGSKIYNQPQDIFLLVGIIMPLFYIGLILWYYMLVHKYESKRKNS
jgi:O-antigen/teichoic acid export membrane protein